MQEATKEFTYTTFGAGDRHMIAIHGWLMSSAVYEGMAAQRELGPWTIVAPELVGSPVAGGEPGVGIDEHAERVLGLAEHLGWERFDLVGHSMGGTIAQRVATMAPEKVEHLLLLAPVPASGVPLDEQTRGYFRGLGGNREALRGFLEQQLARAEDRARLLTIAERVSPAAAVNTFRAWSEADFERELAQIRATTLVVGGAEDAYLPPEALEAKVVAPIAGARLEVISGVGHYPQVDRPDEVAATLARFCLPT